MSDRMSWDINSEFDAEHQDGRDSDCMHAGKAIGWFIDTAHESRDLYSMTKVVVIKTQEDCNLFWYRRLKEPPAHYFRSGFLRKYTIFAIAHTSQ